MHADLHLPIIPGTDVALYNSMMNEFIQNGFIDKDMVKNYLSFQAGKKKQTFEKFKKHVAQYPVERAAKICGIAPRDIQEAAFMFASAKATTSLWTMGLNQQVQATASNRGVSAMHLLTGQIGRPGATPFSVTGQPNACGGVRDTGSLSHALPNGRVVANPKHREEMEDLWKVPRGRINPKIGYHTMALFDAINKEKVKCCLVMCTNPAQTLPNNVPYRKGMEKVFMVVVDSFHPTETTKFADVVLPAAMWVEKEGVAGNAERRYHLYPKVVDPPGEARSDLDILVDFADRLGHGDLIAAPRRFISRATATTYKSRAITSRGIPTNIPNPMLQAPIPFHKNNNTHTRPTRAVSTAILINRVTPTEGKFSGIIFSSLKVSSSEFRVIEKSRTPEKMKSPFHSKHNTRNCLLFISWHSSFVREGGDEVVHDIEYRQYCHFENRLVTLDDF